MTDYSTIDFQPLVDAVGADEVVTHSYVRDIVLPSGRTIALLTLDNGRDHTRPNTLGPVTMVELGAALDAQRARAGRGEIAALAVIGKPFILAAGADLSKAGSLQSREQARLMAQLGHHVLGKLGTLGVPSFVFINGLALGGGVEIGLHANYRTIDSSVPAIALPEVFLGIVPGWGGATLLPNLIGIENALQVVIQNPLRNNRMMKGPEAFELGIADAMFGPANFLEDSLAWADGVLSGTIEVKRPHRPGRLERLAKWDIAIKIARDTLTSRIGTAAKSPYAALELLKAAKDGDLAKGFEREDEVLAELISGDQFRASMYAFDLVQKRAKRPAGAPDKSLAKPVTQVGIIGAGLMASQLALQFVRRLKVPVVMTDLDQARVDKGIAYVRGEIDTLEQKGRIDADEANQLRALISGTTDKADFARCDWVIEAVFEELSVKQQVFGEVEPLLSETAVLATNTSSLVVEEIGAKLAHPERLVGFHFFNPVAVMPLLEVVRTPQTDEATLSTAMVTAAALRKNAIITGDRPGFVVNRLLAKVFGEAARALDEGTPVPVVEHALDPIGLPMTPLQLLDLVGWAVAAHVQDTMHERFGDRFYASANLHALAKISPVLEKKKDGTVTGFTSEARKAMTIGNAPLSGEQILRRVEDELVGEIQRMLDEGVVTAVEDIDLGLILGAGWPFQAGGITPYLDRVGATERVLGRTFHNPPLRGLA